MGWGNPIDPDKDCKFKREKDTFTIEMPGIDHDYDPVRKRSNAPRLLTDIEGEFDWWFAFGSIIAPPPNPPLRANPPSFPQVFC